MRAKEPSHLSTWAKTLMIKALVRVHQAKTMLSDRRGNTPRR